jgi:DoxX-like family
MKKRDKIIYWVATVWLALGMTSTGIVQLLHVKADTEFIIKLGYPEYFLNILGFSKLLGVIAMFVPKTPLVKEWAYAGFFFTMSGALYSHFVMGSAIGDIFPPILLIVLIVTSWYFRPADKKVVTAN